MTRVLVPGAGGSCCRCASHRGPAAGARPGVAPLRLRGSFSPSPPPACFCLSTRWQRRAGGGGLVRPRNPHVCGGSPARLGRRPRRCRGLPPLRASAAAGRPRVERAPPPPRAPPGQAMEPGAPPDLRDVEQKLGRKVPESLARPLRGEELPGRPAAGAPARGPAAAPGPRRRRAAALARLETKLHLLRQEMVNLRATDVKLMRQLLIINESIESIKWMIEEKAIASRGSSLSGSLCSLLESQETSLHGSCNSLQDCSDGLDGISVGSYLDTLVDDVPGHRTPSDVDQFSDSSIMEDSQPLHKHPKIDSDEYYCFG
ncbi:leucine rich adaptor protein 1-like [Morphnus guianensis]